MLRSWIVACVMGLASVASAEQPSAPHLVFVSQQDGSGHLDDGQNVRCDLTQKCDVTVRIGAPTLKEVVLRLFAEDGGGVSLVPISRDSDGHMALGRRLDMAWGPRRTVSLSLAARPVRLVQSDDFPFSEAVVAGDAPPVATLVIAVREMSRPASLAGQDLN